jgi:hypothetical protein
MAKPSETADVDALVISFLSELDSISASLSPAGRPENAPEPKEEDHPKPAQVRNIDVLFMDRKNTE